MSYCPFKCTVFTDHKPLTYALSRVSDPWMACQCCRQLSYGEELTYDITLINNKIKFSSYKDIQMGVVVKSYMRKGFLIYQEMRKYLVIYEEAVRHI
jgi:hypothetical protein